MNIQDVVGVKKPEDLERKYNLSDLQKNLTLQKGELQSLSNDLINFVAATTTDIQNIQNQVDGSLSTWFFSGIPTLSNSPAVDWLTDEDKNLHVGDLYYDKDTGFSYRFLYDSDTSSYIWLELNDSQITQALAIANAAQDTADSKRRVFVVQPIPPYDNGDLWLSNGDLYRCQISKASGTYSSSDFILATKYTDDTIAIQVGNDLTVLSGEVLTIRQDVDNVTTTLSRDYYTKTGVDGQINVIKQEQSTLTQTVDGLNLEINDIQVNGTIKVVTSTGFKFDQTGLSISKTGSPIATTITENGFTIKNNGANLLVANSTGITITGYIAKGENLNGITIDATNGFVAKENSGTIRTKTTLNATDGIKIEKSTDSGSTFPTKLLWIDTNGNINFTGNLSGATGTFSGSVTIGGSASSTLSVKNASNVSILDVDKNGMHMYGDFFTIQQTVSGNTYTHSSSKYGPVITAQFGNGVDRTNQSWIDSDELYFSRRVTSTSEPLNYSDIYLSESALNITVDNLNTRIDANWQPMEDNVYYLGSVTPKLRWAGLCAGTTTIYTSDERYKQQITNIPDEWLDAWEELNYVKYKFNDAVELKGDDARWHVGLIAQEIERVFKSRGLDAFEIGLLCYDEWEEYTTEKRVLNSNGEKEVITVTNPSGNIYSIRADECQFMEMALMRRELNKLKGVA